MEAAANNVIPLPTMDEQCARVTPGEYTGVYVRHVGMTIFRVQKLCVYFQLVEHPEIVLPRWYCVKSWRGRVRAGPHSDLVRELSAIQSRRVRADRVTLEWFERVYVTMTVRDVVVDRKQNPLDSVNQYSVIDRLIRRAL